jgi:DNA modification methylase
MSFNIKNMDAILFIKKLKKQNKKNFIDAVITDPPYNISKDNNFKTIGRAGINFGI